MASINDIGTPGQPLNTPPLTAWQAAVRDAITAAEAVLGAITPAAGWVDFGASYAGLHLTKQGRLVNIGAMVKPSADTALTAGTNVTIGSIGSAPQRPARDTTAPCVYKLAGGAPVFGSVTITTTGTIIFASSTTGTMTAASGWISLTLSYRSAS